MKLNSGFGMRELCGERFLVPEGLENIDFSKIISLNESAAFLWEGLQDKKFEVEDMVDMLCAEYDVPADVALRDCMELSKQWVEVGLASC